MTEQEAEVLVSRFMRIWPIAKGALPKGNTFEFGMVSFELHVTPDIEVHVYDAPSFGRGASLNRGPFAIELVKGEIHYRYLHAPRAMWPLYKPFADEWLPFFRRGCWLSGCPIEASAHEKAEWMQGFSREELESWNLT